MRNTLAKTALGLLKADIVIQGGKLVNVITSEIYPADVAIKGDRIAFIGNVNHTIGEETKIIDAKHQFIVPGLIDQHVHTYESQMNIVEYAAAVLPLGITGIVTDFYGECVIGGTKAVRDSIEIAKKETPLKILYVLPMPAFYQNSPYEHTGHPTIDEMHEMLDWDETIGTNDTFGIKMIKGDTELETLINEVQKRKLHVCGHGSELNEVESNAWMAYIKRTDDHECITKEELLYKARLGMYISMRIGSGCVDIPNLCRALVENKIDTRRFTLNTDIISPLRISEIGHLDNCIREVIKCGITPIEAIKMATINTAECVKVEEDLGSITPGKIADILLVNDIIDFDVKMVIANGKPIAEDGKLIKQFNKVRYPDYAYNTINIGRRLTDKDFKIVASKNLHKVRVICCNSASVITQEELIDMESKDGLLMSNTKIDVLKVASIRRNTNNPKMFCGFIKGFNLKSGAIASSYNPHNQNITVIGTNDNDMALAVNTLAECGGGFIVVEDGKIIKLLNLPVFGLLSDKPLNEVVAENRLIYEATKMIGCTLPEPFHTLAFVGLPVILGNIKITPNGLVDVWKEKYIDLIVD